MPVIGYNLHLKAVSFEEFTTTNQRLLEVEESLRKLIDEKNTLENNYNNSIDELILVKNKLAEAEGLTDALNIQINSAQSLLNDLNASISEKDENIESLIKDNKNLENTISEYAEIINKRNQSIENLEKNKT